MHKTTANAKVAIQEITKYSQKWHNGTSRLRSTETSNRLAASQAQLNNLGREIKKVNEKVYDAQVGCEQYPFTKDLPIKDEIPKQKFMSASAKRLKNTPIGLKNRSIKDAAILKQGQQIKTLVIQIGQYEQGLRERIELDLEARLRGETLVINRTLDPLNGDYIELNDLNEPFELRRNQGDDLMPTIEEVRTFSIVTYFAVLEDMDAYRDEGMDYVIVGEPFLKENGIKERWFEGMITIYNCNDEVTYQMVRSHPRFKHHTNKKCNKIPPLLKVSEEDKRMESRIHNKSLKGSTKES
ncbi:hypothetical protein Tco_0653896 [Tanacetum coccineum]|uniref:Uncharacterized protein n=1 Tax=Tanacetum coccineum TaxID=301880 RepID=A0ABQ4X1T1_9ASTR